MVKAKLLYKKIGFSLSFREDVVFTSPPEFVFRSVIGYHLRRMCCIAHDKPCFDCLYSATCVYGSVFESVIPKDNRILAGRDRIAHPVVIEADRLTAAETASLVLNIIFTGSSLACLPYFFQALKKGGESGVLKQRTPYTIRDCFDYSAGSKRSLLVNAELLNTNIEPDVWEFDDPDGRPYGGELLIQLQSPLRFKVGGRYSGTFTAADFALCLHRRTETLCSQYGSYTGGDKNAAGTAWPFFHGWNIAESALGWKDWTHYSARQKKTMRLGGLTGSMVLAGFFTPYEYAILRFAEIFHAGKNTNFGLGKIALWEKDRAGTA
ncbi:MAG: CRISPR system precrRNA processing endoribonuclease RAMP protein Cas6 [Treponema sp.]|jgi:hypothetical protein|nr:CRISPR system precrRNA processing endoribonuclease RAMP protein Cas6 [Treponema sp.]